MSRISKRDELLAQRRAEIAAEQFSPTAPPECDDGSPTQEPASIKVDQPTTQSATVRIVNSSADPDGDDARARGAGVGKLMANLQGGMAGQLARAKEQLSQAEIELSSLRPLKDLADGTAMPVRELDPATVMPTRFKNRDEKSFDPEDREFKAFLDEIERTGGNEIPGFVRPLAVPQGQYLYECVYGHRRLQAALLRQVPYRAIVKDVDDDQAVLLQQAENSSRKKLSAIERGQQIASYLIRFRAKDTGRVQDGTLQILATALKTDSKFISKLALIGQIPQHVVDKIPDVRDVPFKPAYLLARACRDALKEVEARLDSLPDGANSRRVVLHLQGVEKRPTPVAARYSVSMPGDPDVREAFMDAVRALEEKFGVHLALKEVEG